MSAPGPGSGPEASKAILDKLQKEVSEILEKPESLDTFKEFLRSHSEEPLFKEILEYAMFLAIEKDKIKEVEHLFSYKHVFSNRDPLYCREKKERNTPIIHAFGYGSVEMIKLLLDHLDNKSFFYRHVNSNGYNAISFAISRKRKDIISYLKSLDAKEMEINIYKNWPLCREFVPPNSTIMEQNIRFCSFIDGLGDFVQAILEGDDIETLEYLYEHHPKEIEDLYRPIMTVAAQVGSIKGMECILKHNPDALKIKDVNGFSPLYWAVRGDSLEAAEFIIKHDPKALIEERASLYGIKQVEYIFECVKLGKLKEIMEWVENGHILSFIDYDLDGLLHIALQYNQIEVAKFLLDHGISLNALNRKEETPFMKALRLGNVKSLVEIFNYRAEKIMESGIDGKIAEEKIKELKTEFETLIQNEEAINIPIDYEALALYYDRKYWLQFAEGVVKLKKTPDIQNDEKKLKEFYQKKEKLGELIYGGHILCKENDNGGLSFEIPETTPVESLEVSEGLETKEIEESEEARQIRLKWALKFAMDGQNFASAMRILLETSQEASTLSDIIIPSQKAQNVKSMEDFVMLFMTSTYKPKSKPIKKEAEGQPRKDAKQSLDEKSAAPLVYTPLSRSTSLNSPLAEKNKSKFPDPKKSS